MFKELNKTSRAGISYSVMIVLFFIITVLGQSVLNAFVKADSFTYMLISGCYSLLALFVVLSFNYKEIKPIFGKFSSKTINYTVLAVVLTVAMLFALGNINGLIAELLTKLNLTVSATEIKIENFGQFVAYVIVLGILPAVLEEAFFRGLILSWLKDSGTKKAVVISALLFSLYHMTAVKLVYQFIFGIFLAILAVKSQSVIPSVIAHMLNNILLLILLFIGVEIEYTNLVIIIIGVICFAFVITVFIVKRNEKVESGGDNTVDKNEENGNIIQTFLYASLGILSALALIVVGLI